MKTKICINKYVVNKAAGGKFIDFTYKFERFDISPRDIFNQVAVKGHSFCVALLEEKQGFCHKVESNFIGGQILAVDIDNINSHGKKKSKDEGYWKYDDALSDDVISQAASFLYSTASHSDDHHRFRIVFVLSHFCNEKEKFRKAIHYLTSRFGDDEATKSVVQGFFGSKNATRKDFLGNILGFEEFDRILELYDQENSQEYQNLIQEDFSQTNFELSDYREIISYIFKNGKVPNEDWWKVPTILSAYCKLSKNQIIELISEFVEPGDAEKKIDFANRYIHNMTIGTLIYMANQNGYQMPVRLRGSNFKQKFWKTEQKVNDDGKIIGYKYFTNEFDFQNFLENQGFKTYYSNGTSDLIRVEGKVISKTSEAEVRNFIISYLKDDANLFANPLEYNVVNTQYRKASNRLVTHTIKNLEHINSTNGFEFQRDERAKLYLFYQNGCLKVDIHSIDLIEYSDLNGYVHQSKIVPREFIKSDSEKSIVEQYVEKLSTQRDADGSLNFNKEKFKAFKSILGYLSHNFKRKEEAVAIILTDSNLTISDESEGGSGKSLFAKILSYVRNLQSIDGRNFKNESEFKLDLIDYSTDVVLINDCHSNFPFANFYNSITDDLQVRKLYTSTQIIPFELSPKFIFTTNSVFQGDGSSDRRRKLEIEVSNYFNLDHKPSDEFGILFDWDEKEWARFDSFIIDCIQFYLKNGLQKSEPTNVKLKRLQVNTSEEFVDFALTHIEPDKLYWMDKLHNEFNIKTQSNISIHKFTKFIKKYNDFKGFHFYDEYIKKANNRRMIVLSVAKSEDIVKRKSSKEFNKMMFT